jgi:hypothetical protein
MASVVIFARGNEIVELRRRTEVVRGD